MDVLAELGRSSVNGLLPNVKLSLPQPQQFSIPLRAPTPENEFTGSVQAVQFRLPSRLVRSLQLLVAQTEQNLSDIVFEALTTDTMIAVVSVPLNSVGRSISPERTEAMQIKLPSDLIHSLRLLAIQADCLMDTLVAQTLATKSTIKRATMKKIVSWNPDQREEVFSGMPQLIQLLLPRDLILSLTALCSTSEQRIDDIVVRVASSETRVLNVCVSKGKSRGNRFVGAPQSTQLVLPSDLILSLRLQSFETGRSIPSILTEALATESKIMKYCVEMCAAA